VVCPVFIVGGAQTVQAAAFWKCLESLETDDDEDDFGAQATVGCLTAIGTILESVSRLPDLFPLMEPTLLPPCNGCSQPMVKMRAPSVTGRRYVGAELQ
jgi:hypothetical protein